MSKIGSKMAHLINKLRWVIKNQRTTPSLKIEIPRNPFTSFLVFSPFAICSTYSSNRFPASSKLSPSTTVPALKSIQSDVFLFRLAPVGFL